MESCTGHQLIRSGDWAVPTLNSLPFFHKPPLFYWLTAASMKVFGVHPWPARMAPWIGATVAMVGLHHVLRRRVGADTAQTAVIVLVTAPFFFLGAQYANMDMLVGGFISASICAFAEAVWRLREGRPHQLALTLAWALAGLGVLSKGLIGIVLPVGAIGLWLLWSGDWRLIARMVWSPGPFAFALVALPWFFAMQARYAGFFDYFILDQHVRRFASTGFNNMQPWWFYPPVVAILSLPWTVMGLWAAMKGRGAPADATRADLQRFLWCWAGVVIVFFSLPASKLIGYVLGSLPPLAGLVALALHRPGGDGLRRRVGPVAVGAALLCVACVFLVIRFEHRSNEPFAEVIARDGTPADRVVALDTYPYDLQLYLTLPAPYPVLNHWDDPEIDRHDDWHKELHDGIRFEPGRVAALLVEPGRYGALLCEAPVSWVIGSAERGRDWAGLDAAQAVQSAHGTLLWRVARPTQCGSSAAPAAPAPAKAQ